MRHKLLLLIFSFSILSNLFCQFTDNFNDGDFSTNPAWTGNTSDWLINPTLQLQSNNTTTNATFYLSTANNLATTAQWEFWCQLAFNPSSTNYVDVYLTASANDITQSSVTGYHVRIGNTNDEICLYRKNANGTSTLLIDGIDGILNTSNNAMKIKIIRDAANQWTLLRDLSGTGNNYVSEGNATDATFTTSVAFGVSVRQSTASFFQKHFFDGFEVKTYTPDITPPQIVSATATAPNKLDILYNEPVQITSAQTLINYTVNNGVGNPVSAQRDGSNNALVHLIFNNNFPNGTTCSITIDGVQDLSGNAISNGTATFNYYTAQRYDIVIDEIMAHPIANTGLPNTEWIEVKNVSAFPINLQNWRISDATGTSGPIPNYTLLPDSFLIVCASSSVAALSTYGNVISVTSFPSLNDDGDNLILNDASGKTIHAIYYTDAWYQNETKKRGGWTLEMMDTKSACSGMSNWKASTDVNGGTPGKKNSTDGIFADTNWPKLKYAYTIDNTTIILVFDKTLDSISAATLTNYAIDAGVTIVNAICLPPLFNTVQLKTNTTLTMNKVYTVTASSIKDCRGNTIGADNKAKVGLASDATTGEWVINEILFNPRSNAYDYVEFYNLSNKIFDASKLYIANRNSSNVVSDIKPLSTTPRLIFPEDYIVVTEDATSLSREYLVKNTDNVFVLSTLPSYPDDKGFVVALNFQGEIVDEVNYSYKWHFKLIDNEDGVSLERIDPAGVSQDANNWHSAASTAGFGTPTYKNSQYKLVQPIDATIEVSPKVFSPDNDGYNDIATIQYKIAAPGYVANITIFDAAGRPIRNLVKNGTLSLNGYWNWDGLDDKGNKLPIGTYIIFTEIFNLQGKKQHFKNTVVLARKL